MKLIVIVIWFFMLNPIIAADVFELCAKHPWGRPDSCPRSEGPTVAKCHELLEEIMGCDLTADEYIACAEAMQVAACNERPEECERVSKCLGSN